MAKTRSYRELEAKVLARPGAKERIGKLREETLREIGLYELRLAQQLSQLEVAE